MVETAEELNVDLILFAGHIPDMSWDNNYQHEPMYHLLNKNRIDGVIVFSAPLSLATPEKFKDIFNKIEAFPIVCISHRVEPHHLVDLSNDLGVIEAIEHLVQVHNRKRIAIVKGTKGFIDSEERFEAYKYALEKNNIEFDPKLVAHTQYTQSSAEIAVEEMLSQVPDIDAIFCVNDDLAMGVMRRVKKLGFSIPHQISIVGHDDITECKFVSPPLATISQPGDVLAEKSITDLIEIIKGHTPEETKGATKFIARESCGCHSSVVRNMLGIDDSNLKAISLTEILRDFPGSQEFSDKIKKGFDLILNNPSEQSSYFNIYYVLQEEIKDSTNADSLIKKLHFSLTILKENLKNSDHIEIAKVEHNFTMLRVLLSEAKQITSNLNSFEMAKSFHFMGAATTDISNSQDMMEFYEAVKRRTKELSISRCWLSFYEEPFTFDIGGTLSIPEYSNLMVYVRDEELVDIYSKEKLFKTKDLLPDWVFENEATMKVVVMPLFFGKTHFGSVVLSLSTFDDIVYESLREVFSSVLWRIRLTAELEESKLKLEATNAKLEELSIIDDLTGLLNRRGFLTAAEQYYKDCLRSRNSFVLAYADLNGLKGINDTFGHNVGDEAICATAKLLKQSFREVDLFSRQGGDEFTILLKNMKSEVEFQFSLSRLNENINNYNKTSEKPFSISLSIGWARFDPENSSDVNIEQLMKEADACMYRNKKL